jgi:hypothetical protein
MNLDFEGESASTFHDCLLKPPVKALKFSYD